VEDNLGDQAGCLGVLERVGHVDCDGVQSKKASKAATSWLQTPGTENWAQLSDLWVFKRKPFLK
jgi:hypothetical protein